MVILLITLNMKLKTTFLTASLIFTFTLVFSQNQMEDDTLRIQSINEELNYKHSIGASLLMVTNFLSDPADYYLLTYGYRLSQKNRVFAEFNTWKYSEPIGTYENSEEYYPGYIRCWGLGFGYQRFLWKGAFTTVQGTSFLKNYFNENNEKIQNGYQLYLQFAVGYRFEFFKKRMYIEPAWALKYWPVDTNFPESFAKIEEGAPVHIFEPSLNFGFKF